MNFLSAAEFAKKWNLSECKVREYCISGRIPDAFQDKDTWNIPEIAQYPKCISKKGGEPGTLLEVLRTEKESGIRGGIYHKIQIELTYNSNHIEGSRLTRDQTRYIFETNTIGLDNGVINVDDIVETVNHFKCIDLVIDSAYQPLRETFIKKLHQTLKSGTSDSRKDWFAVGAYKRLPNEVGGRDTVLPEQVAERMKALLAAYNKKKKKLLIDLIEFHAAFEAVHPFQDGNGRVGRLILFKECLKNNIVPFIIDEELKLFYYRGLHEWKQERGYLIDTCLAAQDRFRKYLDYFRIPYEE